MTVTIERPATLLPPAVLNDPAPVSPHAPAWNHSIRRSTVPPHGNLNRYSYWGCRCGDCRAARLRRDKLRQAGLVASEFVPLLVPQRQLQALAAVGWTNADVARQAGLSKNMVQGICAGTHGATRGVRRQTAEALDAAYRHMVDLPEPTDPLVGRCRAWAKRMGYFPPEAWTEESIGDPDAEPYNWDASQVDFDHVIVDRTLEFIAANPLPARKGIGPRKPALWGSLPLAERREVVRVLLCSQMSIDRIALNLGVHSTPARSFIIRRGRVLTPELRACLGPDSRGDVARAMVTFRYRGIGLTVAEMGKRVGWSGEEMATWLAGPGEAATKLAKRAVA